MKKIIAIAMIACGISLQAQTNVATNVTLSPQTLAQIQQLINQAVSGVPTPQQSATAATVTSPLSAVNLFWSYITSNDTNCQAWVSNRFTVAEAAVFASVKGTPGESAVGNNLIAEVSLYKNFGVDSQTRFEQLMGDIADQEIGIDYYFYEKYQIRLTGGVDFRDTFVGGGIFNVVPNVRLEKASTQLGGLGVFLEYGIPIRKNPGFGELSTGVMYPIPGS